MLINLDQWLLGWAQSLAHAIERWTGRTNLIVAQTIRTINVLLMATSAVIMLRSPLMPVLMKSVLVLLVALATIGVVGFWLTGFLRAAEYESQRRMAFGISNPLKKDEAAASLRIRLLLYWLLFTTAGLNFSSTRLVAMMGGLGAWVPRLMMLMLFMQCLRIYMDSCDPLPRDP